MIKNVSLYENDIVAFANDLFYFKPGERIKLWPEQEDILYKATEKDENGQYRHKVAIFSYPRQNGKSELSTILGVHSLFFGGYGFEILSIGIGGKDTARVIFRKAKRAIRHSPMLYESIGDKNFQKDIIAVPELESSWEIKASEVLSSIGRSFDLVLFDELGMERVELNEGTELYDSVTAGQASKPNSRIIITSTVGGEQGKLYDLMKLSKTDKNIYCDYRTENFSPLITKAYLERRKRELHPSIYAHWHENKFFSGMDSFISPALYDSCVNPDIRPVYKMPKDNFCITWVDIGIKRDASVCVSIFRDAENKIRIAELKSWEPQKLKQEIQLEWIEEYLMEAKDRLNIREIYIDEYQAQAIIQRHGKRLNIQGIHLTSDKLERIWSNFVAIMQNNELSLYDDQSDDMIQLRREALNLTIASRGAGFKVSDPGKLHQDRVLALAGACWKMVEKYERERYYIGWLNCPIRDQKVYCPLITPGEFFPQVACSRCEFFGRAFRIFAEAEGITEKADFRIFTRLERFSEKIGGFKTSGFSFPRK